VAPPGRGINYPVYLKKIIDRQSEPWCTRLHLSEPESHVCRPTIHGRSLRPQDGPEVPGIHSCGLATGPGRDAAVAALQSYDLPVVVALTEAEYLDRLQQIDDAENLNPLQKRQLKGRLHSKCRPATVNPQGKLLVPKDWSEAADLPCGDAVSLVGRGTYFEIWNTGNYATVEERENEETRQSQRPARSFLKQSQTTHPRQHAVDPTNLGARSAPPQGGEFEVRTGIGVGSFFPGHRGGEKRDSFPPHGHGIGLARCFWLVVSARTGPDFTTRVSAGTRDSSRRDSFKTGVPHRFWLVVGAGTGRFPGEAHHGVRDSPPRIAFADGPARCDWLVFSARTAHSFKRSVPGSRDSSRHGFS
jgi:DNA-binding transcriptional regulator/RsmH inhibitor MraZ